MCAGRARLPHQAFARSATSTHLSLPFETKISASKIFSNISSMVSDRSNKSCRDCHIVYVRGKSMRHLEPFRVKRGTEINRRRIMVATSYGKSSTTVLELLHWHRLEQLRRARRAEYDVFVVHVDERALGVQSAPEQVVEEMKAAYDQFEYQTVPLQDIYQFEEAIDSVSQPGGLDHAPPELPPAGTDEPTQDQSPELQKLSNLLTSLTSKSSQADMISILRTRLIIEIAKKENCEAILFGDSLTRVAQMVLAEVTKGRGHAIPWLISDGPTPYGMPQSSLSFLLYQKHGWGRRVSFFLHCSSFNEGC